MFQLFRHCRFLCRCLFFFCWPSPWRAFVFCTELGPHFRCHALPNFACHHSLCCVLLHVVLLSFSVPCCVHAFVPHISMSWCVCMGRATVRVLCWSRPIIERVRSGGLCFLSPWTLKEQMIARFEALAERVAALVEAVSVKDTPCIQR